MKQILMLCVVMVMLPAACRRSVNVNVPSEINLPGGGGGGNGGYLPQIGGIASEVFMGAEHGAVYYAYDTLAHPGQAVDLTIRLQKAYNLVSIEGATIGFYLDDEPLGRAETNGQGVATVQWAPPGAGNYRAEARIESLPRDADPGIMQVRPAPLLIAAHPPETPIAIIDLDYTVVASPFLRVLLGMAEPMADSQEVLHELVERDGLTIVYLTHRPNLLTRRSKDWLSENEYPVGPLLVASLTEVVGGSRSFKTAKLGELLQAFPNVQLGIGDKISDAQSYQANDIQAYLLPHYDADKPREMNQIADEIASLEPNVQVVDNWREIRAGIFEGRRYPPEDYVQRLRQRARRLAARD